jgi:predicted DNA binding CopG/RHH family protein
MKLEADEKELLDSVDRGEWRSTRAPKRGLSRYSRAAKATFKKDRRLNIRISTKDLEAIQKRALEEGLPSRLSSGPLPPVEYSTHALLQ